MFSDESTCRICFKKQDTVYSLFRKRKGISPCEKLNKLGVKADANNAGPSCICCDCLAELDITISFLQKCEKSNQILSEQLPCAVEFPDEIVNYKTDNSIDDENKAAYVGGNHVDITQESRDSILLEEAKSSETISLEEAKCSECGSKRRCRHWAPPATHTCPYCQKVFTRKFNFKLHLKRHSGEREWSCCVCGATAVSRWLAARHCAPRRRRACPVPGCGKTYTTTINLNTHLRVHNGERPFECEDCGKKFTSKNTLTNHMRIHTGALPYICPVCGKRFRTNKLSAHLSTHAPGAARHACARGGCALRRTSRRAHLPAPAPPAPVPALPAPAPPAPPALPAPAHPCALCPARYHHKQSLNKHVKKQHSQKPAAADTASSDITKEIVCNL